MTTWLIGHSTRFAAAVSARGVYNLITQHSMSDAYELVEYSFEMNPWQHAAQLWQASPIAAVEAMHAPLLILHSELDFRVPIGEAEQLYTMLRRLGRTVELVRYPGEGHELTRSGEPNHQIDHMHRTIAWFVRFLGV
jgi:dipeptidyl aminopeptidase/acylaminoacyl peptidase